MILISKLQEARALPEASYADLRRGAKTPTDAKASTNDLTPFQRTVLFEHGTEPPFKNEYYALKEAGTYLCRACHLPLFRADDKFYSGTGWPSFTAPIDYRVVAYTNDQSHGMERIEVHCSNCGGHQGHVFNDGPAPTGLRFCINSASVLLAPK